MKNIGKKLNLTLWLNGRASDSGSEDSGFESQQGCDFHFIRKLIILDNFAKNMTLLETIKIFIFARKSSK